MGKTATMSAPQGLTDPTAVQGRRIGAWIIDVVIIMALGFLVSIAFPVGDQVRGNVCEDRGVSDPLFDSDDVDTGEINTGDANTTDAEICFDNGDLIIFSDDSSAVMNLGNSTWPNLISFLYVVIVFWIWQGLTGVTPGKGIVGIRTVNAAGEAPGVLRAFGRWILWIVDAFPYCCAPLVGGITMLSSKNHRRVGDMVAGTFVVDKEFMGAGPVVGGGAYVPPSPGIHPPTATSGFAPPGFPTATPAGTQPAEPRWDPQREAYIQWDETEGTWMQFDDATQTWKPLV